jgi:hypothetical protein
VDSAPHWCERFVMGRWLNGPTPPMTLPRGKVAVIAPRDVDFNPQDEVDMLQRIGLAYCLYAHPRARLGK